MGKKFNFSNHVQREIGSEVYKSAYMKVTFSGLKELDAALNALEMDVRKNILRKAGVAAMSPVLTRVKAGLDVSADTRGLYKTARMITSMRPKRLRKSGKNAALMVIVAVGRGGKRRKAETGHQALQVEFGVLKRGKRRAIPARPFMRPAVQGKEKLIIKRFGHHLKVGIERTAKKQARRTPRLRK